MNEKTAAEHAGVVITGLLAGIMLLAAYAALWLVPLLLVKWIW